VVDRGGNRLEYVQGLRGIAMLTIVVYHCDLPPTGGFVALDTFFVISGFVIAGMLLREKGRTGAISLVDFYHRRVRRLLPMLTVTIIVTVLLSAVLESPLGAQRVTGRLGAFATVSLANLALYHTGSGYFDQQVESIPLRHTWSLSVEEQFYLVFPLFLAVLLWGNRRRLRAVVSGLVVVGALSFGALAATAYVTDLPLLRNPLSFAYYSPVTRLWEMAVGVAIAVWHLSRPPLGARAARWVGAVGTVGLTSAVVLFTSELESSNPALALPVLGSAMMLVACRTPGVLSRALSWRPFCWVGDRSYGWYLWHWPLIVFVADQWPGNRLAMLAAAALGLAASAVTYPLVEQRFRYPPRDQPRRQQLRAVVRLAAVCVVASAGLSVVLNQAAARDWGSSKVEAMGAQVGPALLTLGPQGCQMEEVLRTGSVDRCSVGDGSGAPIYLLGDSNAGQFGLGLVEAGNDLNRPVVLLWRPACAFNDVTVLRPEFDVEGCNKHNAQVLEWLQRSPAATVVVAEGGEFIDAPDVPLRAPGGDETDSPTAKAQVWEAGLERSLSALRGTGDRVIVLRMLPHPGGVDEEARLGWSALDCGLAKILFSPESCAVSTSLADEDRRQRAELDAESEAVDAAGVEYVDLRETICPGGQCQTRRGDRWIYRDATHITNDTSRSLGPFFADLLGAVPPS
jgi:peptidoglycan/LPS O-acetylase OafA/YrhL